jgi:hypothetical protein
MDCWLQYDMADWEPAPGLKRARGAAEGAARFAGQGSFQVTATSASTGPACKGLPGPLSFGGNQG